MFRLVEDQAKWDQFVTGQSFAQFLQSWQWGEFQKKCGRRAWRVGFFEDDVLRGVAQIIEYYLGLGLGYLYCPRGPIFDPKIETGGLKTKELFEFLRQDVRNGGDIFLRIEPSDPTAADSLMSAKRILSVQPSQTLLLDLTKSEDQLLSEMGQKTRYNVRLAGKKGLAFRPADFEQFWPLLRETSRRDKIKLHPRKYYQLMIRCTACSLLVAAAGREALSAGLFIGFGNTFSYVHGASANRRREMMASYFLHWEAVKFAKKEGYRYYDFGGANSSDRQNFDYRSAWEGITRFKTGFGGFLKSYPGTFDVPFNVWGYRLYRLARSLPL